MAALNSQTAVQFQQYAAQQYPGNYEQQQILIRQLQEQHYQQYMQQLYQVQLAQQQVLHVLAMLLLESRTLFSSLLRQLVYIANGEGSSSSFFHIFPIFLVPSPQKAPMHSQPACLLSVPSMELYPTY